jgi:hypothetical protein
MAVESNKKIRRGKFGFMASPAPPQAALVQSHLRVAGTVVDIVNVRVPSTLNYLRAAGVHVSEIAQAQTCRAVFRSLCKDVDFCSELAAPHQSPDVIYGYINKHIHGVVGRALCLKSDQ